MTDCKKCKYYGMRCYCPIDRHCMAFEKRKMYVKHTFEFQTEEDWEPMSSACWVDCPFNFMIKLGDYCKCLDGKFECPFVKNYKN